MYEITDYKLVSGNANDRRDFEIKVKLLIRDGWMPIGGVAVTSYGYLLQAMVKYEKAENENK